MKIKFWILVVIIYKVTGNVSCKFKSYRGSHKSAHFCLSRQSAYFLCFSGQNGQFQANYAQNRASRQSNGCSGARFLFASSEKIAKNRVYFWSHFTKTKHHKIVAPAGFELFACIFLVVFTSAHTTKKVGAAGFEPKNGRIIKYFPNHPDFSWFFIYTPLPLLDLNKNIKSTAITSKRYKWCN